MINNIIHTLEVIAEYPITSPIVIKNNLLFLNRINLKK